MWNRVFGHYGVANFVEFIGEGRGSHALAKALLETERRVDALKTELKGLRRSREKVFQAPPVEWIEERLGKFKDILEQRTERSALILRKLLGPIHLEPTHGDIGRPYYIARTSINSLAIMETPPQEGGDSDDGSNSLRWWRRRESNPNQLLEDTSTDSDTSRTEHAQNHYTKSGCDESPADAKPKDATEQIHFPDTSDTSLCAPGVPGKNDTMDSLPWDLPSSVVNGIRNWHRLPEQIRSAIEALLETIDLTRAAKSEERHRR